MVLGAGHRHCYTMDSLTLLLPLLLAASAVSASQPPNILYIMADDLGYNDVSWTNPAVITPNLQDMADDGVILSQSYSQAACTPSRASYLTGYYPFRIGVQNSVVREGMADYVPLDVDFLPKRLKEAGYSTHLVGKWHLGHCRRDVTPTGRGFDTFLGLYNGYNDYYTKKIMAIASHEDFDPNAEGTIYDFFANTTVYPSPEDEYTTDIFTERAQEIIKEFKDSPFFIALHYTAPHWPLQNPPDFDEDLYKDVDDKDRKMYLAMVTAMDEGIGEVMDTLREEGVLDNTIVVFQSDNGGDTHFAASNEPLRERKTTLYEGGVRVPSLVYSPGLLANTPRVSEDLFHIADWFTTLLAAAGVDAGNVDGVNQWDMLRDGVKGPRDVFIYNIHGDNAAIRARKYKLIEGDPHAFQARRKKRSVGDLEQDTPSTRQKRQSSCRAPQEQDEVRILRAFNSLTGIANIAEDREGKEWTMDSILELLESYGPADVTAVFDCHDCELYDLQADPSETQDLSQDLPAVVLYLHNLLELYKAEEVEPVLKFPYHEDPRFTASKESNITSNTWCED
ncbi:arylsulfatase B-like [Babylonia areolata]|uniref:arylsulfatase B-like n=1 Tax=Babylonia areolata TaxID=304850 RepID=UPI003FD5FA0B